MVYSNCPFNGEQCVDGWRKDFKADLATGAQGKCMLWRAVRGKRPQSEEVIDKFDCAYVWQLEATIEVAQRVMHTGVSVQEVRNTLIDLAPEDNAAKANENSLKRMLVQATAPSLTQGQVKPNEIGQAVVNRLENKVDGGNNGNEAQ